MKKVVYKYIRVLVVTDSAEERAVIEWLRRWRRQGVRSEDKVRYEWQGTGKVLRFRAPSEAVADLAEHLLPLGGSLTCEET